MPTVIAHHDVKDKDHWLASPKREEFFGPHGVTISLAGSTRCLSTATAYTREL